MWQVIRVDWPQFVLATMRRTSLIPMSRHRRNVARGVASLLVAAGLWWLIASWSGQLGIPAVRAALSMVGPLAPLAYIVVLAVSILIPPFPDALLVVAAGLIFGFVPALGYTLIGGLLGATGNFALVRRMGRPRLRAWLGPVRFARVDALAARTSWLAVFLTRLLPGFNFDLVSYAAGLTSMSVAAFLTATLGGMFVPVVVLVTAGTEAAARPGLALLATAISGITLVLVPALLWWLYRRGWLPALASALSDVRRPEAAPSAFATPETSNPAAISLRQPRRRAPDTLPD
jgi:uncharacterized membrane protein YdjX (TVP38/TMEM64 family)